MLTSENQVTRADFFEFYADMAMSVPADDDFVAYVQRQWSINEQDHTSKHTARTRELVSIIRNRALSKSQGQQIEFYLTNLFRELDANKNVVMSLSELYALVGKLGIRIDNSNLQALMAAVDSNHNGVIEFEEFVHFIAADRYK